MRSTKTPVRAGALNGLLVCAGFSILTSSSGLSQERSEDHFAETFDAHWECLRGNYPYFDLYGVDWEAERDEHRAPALAAENATEFAWELARLISVLPDSHVSFIPAIDTIQGHWSYPMLDTCRVERRWFVLAWPTGQDPEVPTRLAGDPYAYPEILAVRGVPLVGSAEILAAGPIGTTLDIRLRWPDGTEADHTLLRPNKSNLPPDPQHYGKNWLITGRVGSVGYIHIKSFAPKKATLGPDGKMTTMLRAALAKLHDTEGLILDLQGNGGGQVAASDPFLGHFLKRSLSYRWGNSGGKRRVIRPGKPRYSGSVVALVDENSASGGEWAARILRDAGRATVVGGRAVGAEAAIHRSTGPDGSVLTYSAWPMAEQNRKSFQETGIELDHAIPLTIAQVHEHGYDQALLNVHLARLAKALELLGASSGDLDELSALAEAGLR